MLVVLSMQLKWIRCHFQRCCVLFTLSLIMVNVFDWCQLWHRGFDSSTITIFGGRKSDWIALKEWIVCFGEVAMIEKTCPGTSNNLVNFISWDFSKLISMESMSSSSCQIHCSFDVGKQPSWNWWIYWIFWTYNSSQLPWCMQIHLHDTLFLLLPHPTAL